MKGGALLPARQKNGTAKPGQPATKIRMLTKRSPPGMRRHEDRMDKKAKKRLDVINKKLQTLRPRLAGSRQQADDPEELRDLENEVAELEAEAARLKAAD
jgi:hypothetical protein